MKLNSNHQDGLIVDTSKNKHMYYSNYLEHESQSSKWDRVRIDYDLVKQIIKAKESQVKTKYNDKQTKIS